MGIENPFSETAELLCYPNPANETLNIDYEIDVSALLKIFNANGQMVLSKEVHSNNDLKVDINILPAGLYLLTIYNSSGISTVKFFKN